MQIGINAIGVATPRFKYSEKYLAEFVGKYIHADDNVQAQLDYISSKSAIDFRYSVLGSNPEHPFPGFIEQFPSTKVRMQIYALEAVKVAIKAVKNCFASNNKETKKKITHLITVSCSGMSEPGLGVGLIKKFKLDHNIHRIAVNFMGCHATFNALKIAFAICKSDRTATVLIVAVELTSLHLQNSCDMGYIVGDTLFGDGAGAMLVGSSSGQNKSIELLNFASQIMPKASELLTWKIGDHGFEMGLSEKVPRTIEKNLTTFLSPFLTKNHLNYKNLKHYAIHPGGKKVIHTVQNILHLTQEQCSYSNFVLKNYGNMSSASIIFVLNALWVSITKAYNKEKLLCLGFGPGLTMEAMLGRILAN